MAIEHTEMLLTTFLDDHLLLCVDEYGKLLADPDTDDGERAKARIILPLVRREVMWRRAGWYPLLVVPAPVQS